MMTGSLVTALAICAVVLTVLGAIAMVRRQGSTRSGQASGAASPRALAADAARPASSAQAHRDRYSGASFRPWTHHRHEELLKDVMEEALVGQAMRVKDAPRAFSSSAHPSVYKLTLEGIACVMEVVFWGVQASPRGSDYPSSDYQTLGDAHLRCARPQDAPALIQALAQWLGVQLDGSLPLAAEPSLPTEKPVGCSSMYYYGLVHTPWGQAELFALGLGPHDAAKLWLAIDALGVGRLWAPEDLSERRQQAYHLDARLQGGEPPEAHSAEHTLGLEDETPLVMARAPLAMPQTDELRLRGRCCVAAIQDEEHEQVEVVLIQDVLRGQPRSLGRYPGDLTALDVDPGGRTVALLLSDDEDRLVVLDASTGAKRFERRFEPDEAGYSVCVSPDGQRVAVELQAPQASCPERDGSLSLEDDPTQLLILDAMSGQEIERSPPARQASLGGWYEQGICAVQHVQEVHQGIATRRQLWYEPQARRWRALAPGELLTPLGQTPLRYEALGLTLPTGQRWPYATLHDLDLLPNLDLLDPGDWLWLDKEHMLWDSRPPLVLNARTGRCRALCSVEDMDDHFILAVGAGCVVFERISDEARSAAQVTWDGEAAIEDLEGGFEGVAW